MYVCGWGIRLGGRSLCITCYNGRKWPFLVKNLVFLCVKVRIFVYICMYGIYVCVYVMKMYVVLKLEWAELTHCMKKRRKWRYFGRNLVEFNEYGLVCPYVCI